MSEYSSKITDLQKYVRELEHNNDNLERGNRYGGLCVCLYVCSEEVYTGGCVFLCMFVAMKKVQGFVFCGLV